MDHSVSTPTVLAICMDLQSLPRNARLPWQEHPGEELPRSLAQRMNWRPGVSLSGSERRTPSQKHFKSGGRRFANSTLDIMEAPSAEDAISMLRILRFDLALIGADALRDVPSILKKIQVVSPGTQCIVVSSDMDESRERSVREAGVLAILDAPLPFNRLCDVVGHLTASK